MTVMLNEGEHRDIAIANYTVTYRYVTLRNVT